jgi:hypothetical protein
LIALHAVCRKSLFSSAFLSLSCEATLVNRNRMSANKRERTVRSQILFRLGYGKVPSAATVAI